jgi:hypothetical protein
MLPENRMFQFHRFKTFQKHARSTLKSRLLARASHIRIFIPFESDATKLSNFTIVKGTTSTSNLVKHKNIIGVNRVYSSLTWFCNTKALEAGKIISMVNDSTLSSALWQKRF